MTGAALNLRIAADRAAAIHPDRTVTTRTAAGLRTRRYAEVIDRARRLATVLTDRGVTAGTRVATFAYNSADHLEAQLAVACLGAVIVPLNVRLPAEQLAYVIGHAEVALVVVDVDAADAYVPVAGKLPDLPALWMDTAGGRDVPGPGAALAPLLTAAAPIPAWPDVAEDAPLAICYTSGTTGPPKGVVYTHRRTVLHAFAGLFADGVGLRERDVCLPVVPQFHALGWGLPFSALLAGSGLALPGPRLDPPALAELIEAAGVTVGSGVATVWLDLFQDAPPERSLAGLARLYCGGARVPDRLVTMAADHGVEVLAAWGMTETSPVATYARVKTTVPDDETPAVRTSLGIPFPGIRTRVRTEAGEIAPTDGRMAGELEVSGLWVVDSYYRPDGSGDDRFVTDPDGTRWLRTGDIAVIDAYGYAHLVDRAKDLIKSGGEWISSARLETLLCTHPGVREAAVVAVPHPRWEERPLAVVVPGADPPTEDQLRAHLAGQLPRWQLPDRIIFTGELPRTGVGKIDKPTLRAAHAEPDH